MQIEENVPLAPLTTFRIGGPARFFARVTAVDELTQALDYAQNKDLPVQILGGGSNILFDDDGFNGLVIKIEIGGVAFTPDSVVAGAGESWDALVNNTMERGLWGLENLSGIPGTVGGAVAGSIGAYGQAVAQTVAWVEAFDALSGQVRRLSNAECAFEYRKSVFSSPESFSGLVILRAALKLSAQPRPELSYGDLAQVLSSAPPSAAQVREAVLRIRRGKFPDVAVEGTAGSFFKNPVLPSAQAQALAQRYPGLPLYTMPEAPGRFKIPLGWLMDKALGMRGTREGRARLFENQILVVVAQRGCSAREVRTLAQRVTREIKEKTGLDIQPEVKIL